MTPKEDPADKRARVLERQTAERERSTAAQQTASDLTGDIAAVYGNNAALLNLFNMPAAKAGSSSLPKSAASLLPMMGQGK